MGSNGKEDHKMPQVGQVIEHWKDGSWTVLRIIYSGPFSDVFHVQSNDGRKENYAMKCERLAGIARPALKLDVLVLMAMNGSVGFPRFIAAGRSDYYRYCVMQMVGPDLGKLRRSRSDKRFSPATALRILQQTLNRLEALHGAGWLCRDVKAPNFAIGLRENSSIVYMLDFGFARKYRETSGDLIKPRPMAALVGTFQYCSIAAHDHHEQARRDDIESWLYMAVELLKGPLPWSRMNGHTEHKKMAEYKRRVRNELREEFLAGLPKEFDQMFHMVDSMGFFDRPQYERLHELLEHSATSVGVKIDDPFDWEENQRLVRKAEKVGELGESNLASALLEESLVTDTTPIDCGSD